MFWKSKKNSSQELGASKDEAVTLAGSSDQKTGAMEAHSLSAIARGMQNSINAAQDIAEQHYLTMMGKYFEDGKALTEQIKLPSGHVMDVPLITMVPVSSLALEEVEIKMSVQVSSSMNKTEEHSGVGDDVSRASFRVGFTGQSQKDGAGNDKIEILMHFKRGDTPEGVSKITDAFTQHLQPGTTAAEGTTVSSKGEERPQGVEEAGL